MAKGPTQYLENLIYNTVSRNVAEIFREEALCLAEERLRSLDKGYWI